MSDMSEAEVNTETGNDVQENVVSKEDIDTLQSIEDHSKPYWFTEAMDKITHDQPETDAILVTRKAVNRFKKLSAPDLVKRMDVAWKRVVNWGSKLSRARLEVVHIEKARSELLGGPDTIPKRRTKKVKKVKKVSDDDLTSGSESDVLKKANKKRKREESDEVDSEAEELKKSKKKGSGSNEDVQEKKAAKVKKPTETKTEKEEDEEDKSKKPKKKTDNEKKPKTKAEEGDAKPTKPKKSSKKENDSENVKKPSDGEENVKKPTKEGGNEESAKKPNKEGAGLKKEPSSGAASAKLSAVDSSSDEDDLDPSKLDKELDEESGSESD